MAAPFPITHLKKREDFLRLRDGSFEKRGGFLLQALPNGSDEARIGFTCSKRIGNAVIRNRAKRRLRALAQELLPSYGHAGWDYVFIGRKDATVKRPFDKMRKDGISALRAVHKESE